MSHSIALSPDIGLSADEFVAAWNQDPERRQAAQAKLASAKGAAFDPALAQATTAVLGGLALGLATNALYDLIKKAIQEALARKGRPPARVEIIQVTQPDGAQVLVVRLEG
jgi:hypothetical protein